MTNLAMKLDTLAYSKRLIAAGCEPKLAEAHASLQQDTLIEISEDYLSEVATKEDLKQYATKQDLMMTKQELSTRIDLLEQRVDSKIDALGMKLMLRLGALMITVITTGFAIVGVLIKLH